MGYPDVTERWSRWLGQSTAKMGAGAVVWYSVLGAGLLLQAALVVGGALAAVMVAQLLEYGVLASLHRSKSLRDVSYEELKTKYYRAYWLATLLYVIGAALWVYLTERTAAKAAYGVVFFLLWEMAQLVLAIALSSWEEVLTRAKATIRR